MRCLLCALAVLAVAGCSDSSSPPRDTFEISGTLTDADGAPVVGAAVILDYEFRQLESDPPTKTAAEGDIDTKEGRADPLFLGVFSAIELRQNQR